MGLVRYGYSYSKHSMLCLKRELGGSYQSFATLSRLRYARLLRYAQRNPGGSYLLRYRTRFASRLY
jgi:hypothetical protein